MWCVLSGDDCGEEVGALHIQRPGTSGHSGTYLACGIAELGCVGETIFSHSSVWSEATGTSLPLPVLARSRRAFLLSGPAGLPQRDTEELCHSQHQVPHHCTLQVSIPPTPQCHQWEPQQLLDTFAGYLHCSNGIGRSGIFITLHIVLERMVAEGLVDVFQTIKNLRIQRPAMVQTLVR